MDAEIVELLQEIDAAEKEVDDLIASQKADTKDLDAGHRVVAHQLAELQDYTWRLQLYSELEDLKQGMQLAELEDGSHSASSVKPDCSSDQVPAPGSSSADTQLQEASCSCMTTPADVMVQSATGCCPADASDPCSNVQELYSKVSSSGAGHAAAAVPAPAAAKDSAGQDEFNPASNAPATYDGDASGSPYSIVEDLQDMEAMMHSLQAARKQAAELQQLKQHLRQQLDEWALLADDG